MKTFLCSLGLAFAFTAQAGSTLSPTTVSNSAWGANVGWLNGYADQTNGAVIGASFCSGYFYGANVGWISLGNGAPANGYRYQNDVNTDCGVNHDGAGNLSGSAWGANIGWVQFATNGQPKVDLLTGRLSGHVWGANVGWISLSNAFAVVKTDHIAAGADTDGDGIPDAWEYLRANSIRVLNGGTSDTDGDGVPDLKEYLADTDPLDANDRLKITAYSVGTPLPNENHLVTWTSHPSRLYRLQYARSDFNWTNASPSQILGGIATTNLFFSKTYQTNTFFRVEALLPLP